MCVGYRRPPAAAGVAPGWPITEKKDTVRKTTIRDRCLFISGLRSDLAENYNEIPPPPPETFRSFPCPLFPGPARNREGVFNDAPIVFQARGSAIKLRIGPGAPGPARPMPPSSRGGGCAEANARTKRAGKTTGAVTAAAFIAASTHPGKERRRQRSGRVERSKGESDKERFRRRAVGQPGQAGQAEKNDRGWVEAIERRWRILRLRRMIRS